MIGCQYITHTAVTVVSDFLLRPIRRTKEDVLTGIALDDETI